MAHVAVKKVKCKKLLCVEILPPKELRMFSSSLGIMCQLRNAAIYWGSWSASEIETAAKS